MRITAHRTHPITWRSLEVNVFSSSTTGAMYPVAKVVVAKEEEVEAAEYADNVGDLPEAGENAAEEDRLTSITQVKPSPSQISGMSGRTYISSLQNQLQEEKDARQKLESELNELKKISTEISSQLSQI